MSSPLRSQVLARRNERRAANNNYYKLLKTLIKKLSKLCHKYGADIHFLACRNGRYHGFVTTDEKGRLWSHPSADALDKMYPAPLIKLECKPCRAC